MKKYLSVAILAVFVIPSIALASWWNPFSWKIFQKNEPAPEVQVETSKTEIEAEIQARVDEQVKATLQAKADEEVKIKQQKIDEQKKIDEAVKIALEKQRVKTTTQVVTPTPQISTDPTEKNYYLETKSRIRELLNIENSFKTWLQDSSNQFRTASLTLAGYNFGGLYGQSRDAAINLANASIEVNNKMIINTEKWISYYETMLDAMNNDPNAFLDSTILNKLQTPESATDEIEKIKTKTNSSLSSVMNALKYH